MSSAPPERKSGKQLTRTLSTSLHASLRSLGGRYMMRGSESPLLYSLRNSANPTVYYRPASNSRLNKYPRYIRRMTDPSCSSTSSTFLLPGRCRDNIYASCTPNLKSWNICAGGEPEDDRIFPAHLMATFTRAEPGGTDRALHLPQANTPSQVTG